MVALVTGSGLGLLDTTASQLKGAGIIGNGKLGQVGGSSAVNLATGNLILQFLDETLSGTGTDLQHLRTYNSLGNTTDGDNDRWRWLGEKRIVQQGSTLVRTTGDGHEAVYTWNGSVYISAEGDGADDSIRQEGSEWVWIEGSSRTTERYSTSTGWIKSSRDTSGNGANYTFTGDRLTGISDAVSGQTLDLIYDTSNRLARLDTRPSPSGTATQQVHYSYDSSGRLSKVTTDLSLDNSITDGNVYSTTYTYDGTSSRVAEITQSDGTAASFTYENSGGVFKIKTVTDQNGTTTFTYGNGYTEVTNGALAVTRYTYDSQQRLTRVAASAVNGQVQSVDYAYDTRDNVTKVTDGEGKEINYEYDGNSNLTKEVDALGNTITRTYLNNLLVTETRYATPSLTAPSNPETTRYVYDTSGRLRFTVSPEGRVSESRYDTKGLITHNVQYAGGVYNVSALGITATLTETQLNTWVGTQDKTKTQLVKFDYDLLGNLSRKTEYPTVDSSGNGVAGSSGAYTSYSYSAYGQLLHSKTFSALPASGLRESELTSMVYDGMGRELSITSSSGTTTTSYASGTIKVTSAAGLEVTTAYDRSGRVISVTSLGDSQSRVTRYYYDDAGREVMRESADGGREYTFYDAAGRVSHMVDAEGAVTAYIYNKNGKVTEEIRSASPVNTSTWFSNGKVTQLSVSVTAHVDDRITRYAYDNAGRLYQTTEEFGSQDRVSTLTLDGASRVTNSDINGRSTRYFYDKDGRQTGSLNAERYVTEQVYDAAGRLIRSIRYDKQLTATQAASDWTSIKALAITGNQLNTWYFHDAQGRLIGVVNEQGFLTETAYDKTVTGTWIYTETYQYLTATTVAAGDTLDQVRSRSGAKLTTTNRFDQYGRLVSTTTPDSGISSVTYDGFGRVKETFASNEAGGTTTRSRYNAFGELIGIVSGEGAASVSDLVTAIDQYGKRYEYDRMGRRTAELGPQGQKTYLFYDREGRLTYTLNALGEVSVSTFNAFGQVTSVRVLTDRIDPSGLTGGSVTQTLIDRVNAKKKDTDDTYGDKVILTTYNQLGLVDKLTDAQKKTTSHIYNNFGELTDRVTPYGTGLTTTTHFTYDNLGRVIRTHEDYSAKNITSGVRYDGFGRIDRQENQNGQFTYTVYEENGRKVSIKDNLSTPLRVQTNTYDAFGRVLTEEDAAGNITNYSYDDASRSVTITSAEGVAVTTWKTRSGQVLKIRDGNGNETNYAYDKNGQLKTVTDGAGKKLENTYDRSGRLYETRDGNNNLIRYIYDVADRTIEKVVDPGGVVNSRTRYVFDGQGRQITVISGFESTTSSKVSYVFDRNGRVKQIITDPDLLKLSTRYTYDEAGNTVLEEKGTTAVPAQYIVKYEFDALGRKTKQTVNPNGTPALRTAYSYDKAGNLVQILDANDNKSWSVYNRYNEKIFDVNALGIVTGYEYNKNGQLLQKREYETPLLASTLASWGTEVTSVPVVESANDRRTYYALDEDGREQFTLTKTSVNQWVITENIRDGNNNIVETRRYDKVFNDTAINGFLGSGSAGGTGIIASEVVSGLKALGYLNKGWGDSSTTLFTTRRTFFAYDAANRLRFTVDAEGYVTENKYDGAGNVRFQTTYARKPASLADYRTATIAAQLINTSGKDRTTEYRYDTANRLVDQLSSSVTITASNNQTYTGKIKTHINYNTLGQVTSRIEGIVETGSGDITVDARTTGYRYDAAGRQTHTVLAGWYDSGDKRVYQNQDGQTDRFQRITEVTYDAVGNAVRNKITTGPGTFVYQYKVYDAAGLERYDIDGAGFVTGKTYDGLGNVKTQTRYSDAVKLSVKANDGTWSLSELNTLVAGDTQARTIIHNYDAAGRKYQTLMPSTANNYISGDKNTAQNTSETSVAYYSGQGETLFQYNVFGDLVLQRERVDSSRFAETYFYYDLIGRQIRTAKVESYNTTGVPSAYGVKTDYDALGNVTQVQEYTNLRTGSLSVSVVPEFTSSTTDRTQTFTYDGLGRTLTISRKDVQYIEATESGWSATLTGSPIVSRSVYNAFGEITKSYDVFGEAARVKAGESLDVEQTNHALQYDYDVLGKVTKATDVARQVAGTAMDSFRSQVTTRPTTTYTYDIFGNVRSSVVNSSGGSGAAITLRSSYDHTGSQIESINGEEHSTTYQVDVNGRVIGQRQVVNVTAVASPLGYQYTIERLFEYDAVGRQVTTIDINGSNKTGSRQVYNAFGEVLREEKIWGATTTATASMDDAIVTRYEYDSAGRIKLKQSSDGYTYYYYDLKGNATRVVQAGVDNNVANARITENYYDLLGRTLVQRQPYSTGTETAARVDPKIFQTYDHWGNVLSVTDVAGQVTTYTYNHNNQLLSEVGPTTTAYNEAGATGAGIRVNVTRSIGYDLLGRAGREKFVARNVSTGEIVSEKTKYQYFDRVGNTTQTVDATGKRADYAFDIHGNKVGVRDGMGTVTVYDYDRNNQVTQQSLLRQADKVTTREVVPYGSTTPQTITIVDSQQAYNSFDSSQTAALRIQLNRYTYDQAGRKYAEYNNANKAEYYRYDSLNNITLKQDLGGKQTQFEYDELGNKKGEKSLMQVSGSERYVYGTTTTSTSQEGSTPNIGTRTIQVADGYQRVTTLPYGTTNYTTVYGTRDKEVITGYKTTTTAERGSTEIWGTRQVEYVYGYTTTSTAQRGSTEIWGTRQVTYQSGTQFVTSLPYGTTNYTTVYGTRQVEYVNGYKTTTTAERGSTENWGTRQVEYVYGYTTTSTAQRGSTEIWSTRQVYKQTGTQFVTSLPYGTTNYTAVYGTRQVEYIDGYTTTSTSQRGSTAIYESRQVEYVYGYTTTSTAQRDSTPIYGTKTETYISGYTTDRYGRQVAVYSTRQVQVVTGYNTPIYRTRTEQVLVGYNTPIYKMRDEQYVTGYNIPTFGYVSENYFTGTYTTPIYRTRSESYFTGTYNTPIYMMRDEQYVKGYDLPVYSTRSENYFTGTYKTPIYQTKSESYFTGTYNTPIYGTQQEQYIVGYDLPKFKSVTEEYIVNYTTPIYRERFIWKDEWVGTTWDYSKGDYTVNQLNTLKVSDVNDSGNVTTLTYSNSYNDFGQLQQETSVGLNGSVRYEYWENGLLRSKTDKEVFSASQSRQIISDFKYDIRGQRTVESHQNIDTITRSVYGVTTPQNTTSTMTTFYSYDELGRLSNVRSPSGTFGTQGGQRQTTDLKELSYRYDEWGNRRAIKAQYQKPDAATPTTDWKLFTYDAEGRALVADGSLKNGYIVAGQGAGVAYTYDSAGRQQTETRFSYSDAYGTTFETRRNTFNDLGLLSAVDRASIRYTNTSATHRDSGGVISAYQTVESHIYDKRGFRTTSVVNGMRTESTYRDDGQLTSLSAYRGNTLEYTQTDYQYVGNGQMRSYKYNYYKNNSIEFSNTYSYRFVNTYNGSQVSTIVVSSTQDRTAPGQTLNSYDHRGRLVHSAIEESNPKGDKTGTSHKYFAYNAEGRIIGSQSSQFGVSGLKTQSYFYSNGNPLADIGDEGVNVSLVNTKYTGGNTPGTWTVNVGDSLSGIAQALYGDGSLWYVLADANALTMGPSDRFTQTDAGRSLRVPNTNQSVQNNSTTFKPYNSAEVIGDLTPSPEILPPPKSGGGCGALAMIIMVVVAVAVTVVTAGAAAAAMGATVSSVGATGASAWAMGTAVLAGGGGAIGLAAAAVGGFVGSLASQASGVAMGVQDGISLRSAFASSLTTAFTAGIGAAAQAGGNLGKVGTFLKGTGTMNYAARGVATYVAGQTANAVVGLDTNFSWKGLAATSIGYAAGNSFADAVGIGEGFWSGATRGALTGSITGKLNQQWTGQKTNYAQIAIDAFGNQLANSVAEKVGSGIHLKSAVDKPAAAPVSVPAVTNSVNQKETQQNIVQQSVEKSRAANDSIDGNQTQTVATNTTGGFNFNFEDIDFQFIDPTAPFPLTEGFGNDLQKLKFEDLELGGFNTETRSNYWGTRNDTETGRFSKSPFSKDSLLETSRKNRFQFDASINFYEHEHYDTSFYDKTFARYEFGNENLGLVVGAKANVGVAGETTVSLALDGIELASKHSASASVSYADAQAKGKYGTIRAGVGSVATAQVEGAFTVKYAPGKGVKGDVGLQGELGAAAIKANIEAKTADIDLAFMNLSLEGQAEGHVLGASISGKIGVKTLESKPGVKAYLGLGATLLVGGKVGLSADLSIHPRVISAYDSAVQYVTPKVNSAIQYIAPKADSFINWANSFWTPTKK